MQIFLDLEMVLIESWDNWILLKRNKDLINFYSNKTNGVVHLFSNAIDNLTDVQYFKDNMHYLESSFDISFESVSCCVSRMQLCGFKGYLFAYKNLGKKECFIRYIKSIAIYNETYILLDDMVDDEILDFGFYKIQFVKV